MSRVYRPQHEWQSLGVRRRREVARCAAKGHEHPDAHVAAVARAWASEVVRVDEQSKTSGRRALAEVGVGAVLLAAVGAIFGGAAAGASIDARRDGRLARRILAAAKDTQ